MLLANETVAAHLESARHAGALPHPRGARSAEGRCEFEEFVSALGYSLGAPPGGVQPRHFQKLVERIRGTPEERPIAFLMLRTMQKARYDPTNVGHFGLAARDLHALHVADPPLSRSGRAPAAARAAARRGSSDERRAELDEDCRRSARHTSEMERRAARSRARAAAVEEGPLHGRQGRRGVRRLHHRRRAVRPVRRAGRALRRRPGARVDAWPTTTTGSSSRRTRCSARTPRRRIRLGDRGARAGRARRHGAPADRSRPRGRRSSSVPARRARARRRRAAARAQEEQRKGDAGSSAARRRAAAGQAASARRARRTARRRMRTLVVGTAGHIDHGKSTLVQALTGIDPDRLKEEKARGITIELGLRARRDRRRRRVAFVDVPGHERFVRTMLAGVGGIDCVLLVVAADESVMPQTREHFDICRLLRHAARHRRADQVRCRRRRHARAGARWRSRELVAGSFLEGAPVVAVSATTGEGLDALRAALAAAARAGAARGRSTAPRGCRSIARSR